jgi:hypothetical protein
MLSNVVFRKVAEFHESSDAVAKTGVARIAREAVVAGER